MHSALIYLGACLCSQTKNDFTVPVSGTGSAAMEACVANMIEPGLLGFPSVQPATLLSLTLCPHSLRST